MSRIATELASEYLVPEARAQRYIERSRQFTDRIGGSGRRGLDKPLYLGELLDDFQGYHAEAAAQRGLSDQGTLSPDDDVFWKGSPCLTTTRPTPSPRLTDREGFAPLSYEVVDDALGVFDYADRGVQDLAPLSKMVFNQTVFSYHRDDGLLDAVPFQRQTGLSWVENYEGLGRVLLEDVGNEVARKVRDEGNIDEVMTTDINTSSLRRRFRDLVMTGRRDWSSEFQHTFLNSSIVCFHADNLDDGRIRRRVAFNEYHKSGGSYEDALKSHIRQRQLASSQLESLEGGGESGVEGLEGILRDEVRFHDWVCQSIRSVDEEPEDLWVP